MESEEKDVLKYGIKGGACKTQRVARTHVHTFVSQQGNARCPLNAPKKRGFRHDNPTICQQFSYSVIPHADVFCSLFPTFF